MNIFFVEFVYSNINLLIVDISMTSKVKSLMILYEYIRDERIALQESGVDPKNLQTPIPPISYTASHGTPLEAHIADDACC